MGLLNSIGQGLSQAGYAAGDIFAKQAASEQSNIMELERQKRIAEFQAELKNAPLKRYGAILKDEAGKDVTEPGKTEVIDAPSEFIGGENAGIENAKGLINTPPTTRKRTQDEAMTAANARAMQDDPEAYAEYESRIGKPLREERKIDVAEAKNEAASKERAATEERRAREADRKDETARLRDERRWQTELARLDLQGKSLEATNRKIDATIEHWARGDDRKDSTEAKNPERLYSVVNAMNQTIRNLTENKVGTTKPKGQQDEWQRQYDTALRVRDRASALLDENLSARGAPAASAKPTPTPAPAPKPAASGRPPLDSFFKK